MTPASRIGAFFDIDGTLLPPPSLEWRFASWLLDRGLLNSWRIAKWTMFALSALSCGDASAFRADKTYLAGLPTSVSEDWEASLSSNALALFPEAAEWLAHHSRQGHRVFLVSGTLAPLARALARHIDNALGVYATELGGVGGVCSGRIEGKHVSGRAKGEIVTQIARDFGISLSESYAYGNHPDDFAMLSSVGHPVAVNPTRQLKRIARRLHWCTLYWNSLEPAGTSAQQQLLSAKEAH